MTSKRNLGIGAAAVAAGAATAVIAAKKHKSTEGKGGQKTAKTGEKGKEYRNTERGKGEKNSKGIYYTNGNYEAFARPRKPEGVDEKSAYIVGSGLASLAAACFLVRDGQMPGNHIHILEAMDIAGGACDGIYDSTRGYIMRGGREMENHFEREEVKEALSEGYGASSRYSSTLTQRYLYGAKRLPDGTVIRLSVTQNSLLILTLGMLQPIMIIFVIAIILSAFLASRLSKKIVKPLNELNLDKPLDNNGYDELSPLLRRIDTQQKEISRQSEELKQRQNELEVMTSAMSEGIILLNNRGTVLSINKAAAKLFGTDCFCIGEDIVSINRSLELAQLLNKAKNGEHSERVVELGCGQYQMMASPVISNNIVSGIVLLILDVTEKEKAEQLRREFTANVSHELKTPLHTISGSAELLVNGMVKSEDIPIFLKRIYSEAQRMIQLVEDIIRLSHLDEGAEDMKWDMVDLYAVAEETINSLATKQKAMG